MFADLFFSDESIKELLYTINSELKMVFACFNFYKLSLNNDQTKYVLFHTARQKENIPLKFL